MNFQSWIGTLHGGIQATLMDELGGWVITRKLQTTGMTTHLNMRYKSSVPVGKGPIEIRARLTFPKDVAEKDFFFKGCDLE